LQKKGSIESKWKNQAQKVKSSRLEGGACVSELDRDSDHAAIELAVDHEQSEYSRLVGLNLPCEVTALAVLNDLI